jgi:aspartate/methionine/tyrosine aminotransferase
LTLSQIGYLVGPPPLIAAAAKAHSFLVFTVPSSLQRAVAYGLDHEESFYRRVALDAAAYQHAGVGRR